MADQSPDLRGEAVGPHYARRTRGRHAVPRTSALTRLRLPLGKALALTALPTVLVLASQRPPAADATATAAHSAPEEAPAGGVDCARPDGSAVPATAPPATPPLPPLLPARPVPPRAASPSSRRSTWPTRKRAWSRLRRPHGARPPPPPASRTSSVPSSRATPSSRVRHPARVPHLAWVLRRRRRRPRNHPTRHRPHLTRHPLPAIGPLSRRPDRRPPQGPPAPVTSAISRLPRTGAPVDSPPSPGT